MDLSEKLRAADIVVIGAGLFGITVAQQASTRGFRSVVLERRPHIGGNAFSEVDRETGVEVHKYGSHLFHTSNERVWNYVNQFTEFNSYVHHVHTVHDGVVYPMPICMGTINSFFRASLTPEQARSMIAQQAQAANADPDSSLESRAVSFVGRPLYEAFIKGYSWKQWQTDPADLPADIIRRLPVRYTYDQRYFSDKWEGLPLCGYTTLFERMLESDLISVELGVDFFEIERAEISDKIIVYTGPVDRYFNYCHGHLGWRTLDFEFEIHEVTDFQGTSVMNYADIEIPYTRIHEFKHLHPEREHRSAQTITAREYSRFAEVGDEPYYPINSAHDRGMMKKYRALATAERGVVFGGRLGTYQYLDMHMAIASALKTFDSEIIPRLESR